MLNTSQWIPTGHWQTSSWNQNCSKIYHITVLNQRRRNRKESRQYLCLWERAMKEESPSQPMNRTPFTGWEINWERKGTSAARRRVEHLDCIRQNRKRPVHTVLTTFLHSVWDTCLLVYMGVECWNIDFSEENQREDWGWLHRDKLKGLECSLSCSWGYTWDRV